MSDADLRDVAVELDKAVVEPEASEARPEPVEAAGDGVAAQFNDVFLLLFGRLWTVIGGVVSKRWDVDDLADAEVKSLAKASADVAGQYDLHLSPKAAAWLGLGAVGVAVAGPRVAQYQKQVVPPSPKAPDPVAPASFIKREAAVIEASAGAETGADGSA